MRHRVAIETRTDVDDGRGGKLPSTWTEYTRAFVAIEPLKSEDVFTQQSIASGAEFRIRSRYIAGVVPAMRVRRLDDSRKFEIVGIVNPEERNRQLWLNCREDRRA